MSKPVNLSVHKNRIEKRNRKIMSVDMYTAAKKMATDNDLIAYAIVGISRHGRYYSAWDSGGKMPLLALPATVSRVLQLDVENYLAEYGDDFSVDVPGLRKPKSD